MDTYTVSFFGHRQLNDALTIEQHLEAYICQLLLEKEYVEFLVGRDGEFDLLVASVIRRCKREVRSDNSSLVWVLPYETAEYRNHEDTFRAYYDEIQICEEAAHGHYKNAYRCRNQIMVSRSDLVIFCIQHPSGGAWRTYQYAIKSQKKYWNIA